MIEILAGAWAAPRALDADRREAWKGNLHYGILIRLGWTAFATSLCIAGTLGFRMQGQVGRVARRHRSRCSSSRPVPTVSSGGRPIFRGLRLNLLSALLALPLLSGHVGEADAKTVSFGSATYSVTEGGTVSVTLNIQPPRATATEVGLVYRDADRGSGGTARRWHASYDSQRKFAVGKDYEASPKSVTIPANAGSHTFTVRTVDESPEVVESNAWNHEVVEPDETFRIDIDPSPGVAIDPFPVGYSVGANPTATVTIRDNDGRSDTTAPRVASIERHSPSVSPTAADSLTWRMTFDEAVRNVDAGDFSLTGTTATLAVAAVSTTVYDVTASGGDLAGLDGTVTLGFASGQDIEDTSGNALANATPTGTGDNTFVVNNTSPPPQLPVVTIVPGTSPVTEGTNAAFTVSRTGSTASALTVLLRVGESTAGGRDFVAAGDEGDRSVTIPAGSATATWSVRTTGDSTDEPDGTVTVSLRSSGDYTQGSPSSASVTVNDDDDPPPNTPVVSIAGGLSIAEGGTATFTLTANPAPQGSITVSVNVADSGDFADSGQTGTRQVTIGTDGTATLTVTTVNDDADEPNGTIAATVLMGTGYAPSGGAGTASIAVSDDDRTDTDPPLQDQSPEGDPVAQSPHSTPSPQTVVSFASQSSSAGEDAGTRNVRVRLSPAPVTDIVLGWSAGGTATQDADYGIPGSGTVPVAAGSVTADIPVTIADDGDVENDETVVLTLTGGIGYTPGTPKTHTLTITDNDDASPPMVGISGGSAVTEGAAAVFTLTATPAPAPGASVDVRVTVADDGGFAAGGQAGTRTVTIGGSGTARFPVMTENDGTDEPDGAVMAMIAAGAGYMVEGVGAASVTVRDDDGAPTPQSAPVPFLAAIDAGLVRFGRTVGERTAATVRDRLRATRDPGLRVRVAGEPLPELRPEGVGRNVLSTRADDRVAAAEIKAWLDAATGRETDAEAPDGSRSTGRGESLDGTRFALTGLTDSGVTLGVWGNGALSGFDGRQGALSLDGEVTGLGFGADWGQDGRAFGVMLSRSLGDIRTSSGRVETDLSAIVPYAGMDLPNGLRAWGALGTGRGSMTFTPDGGGSSRGADIKLAMAVGGLEGALEGIVGLPGAEIGWSADALWTRTTSDAGDGLPSLGGQSTRLRFGLDVAWERLLASGGMLRPRMELALRHDGGDAETGSGLEFGGGFDWTDPRGFSLSLDARTLAVHEEGGFRDWGLGSTFAYDPRPGTRRGFSAGVSGDLGANADAGVLALMNLDALSDGADSGGDGTWSAEMAYGIGRGRGMVGSPYLAAGGVEEVEATRLGYRIEPDADHAADMSVDVWADPKREGGSAGARLQWRW